MLFATDASGSPRELRLELVAIPLPLVAIPALIVAACVITGSVTAHSNNPRSTAPRRCNDRKKNYATAFESGLDNGAIAVVQLPDADYGETPAIGFSGNPRFYR